MLWWFDIFCFASHHLVYDIYPNNVQCIVSKRGAPGEVYSIQQYVIKFVSDFVAVRWFSSGTRVSSTNPIKLTGTI